jgi:DNA-binding MurR/RpiR family transcriptional regulator
LINKKFSLHWMPQQAVATMSSTSDIRDLFAERVAEHGATMAPAVRRVVQFIDQNRAIVLASSALDLAERIGTSDATVIRSVQALGFAGLGELRQALVATIGRSTPAEDMRRTLEDVGENTARAVDLVLETHDEAMAALRRPEARARIVDAVSALHPSERIVVFGIGPSAALADYVSVLLERSGRRIKTLNTTGIMLADQLLDLRSGDAVLALAYGRAYREVTAIFAEAKRLGLPVVLVTDDPESKLGKAADVVLAAQRGRTDRVALHGATLVGLEALVLGLAAANKEEAVEALQHLNELRAAVSGKRIDVG